VSECEKEREKFEDKMLINRQGKKKGKGKIEIVRKNNRRIKGGEK